MKTALGIVMYNPRYASTLIEKLLKSATVSYTHLVENNLLLVKGAVPGPKKALVTVKETVKSGK